MSDINLKILPITPISIRIIQPDEQLFSVKRLGLPDTPIYLTVSPQSTITGDIITTNVSATGTLNEIEITSDAFNNLVIGLPDDVTVTNDLTVGGIVTAPTFDGELLGTLAVEVKNTSGTTIEKGMPVYATGSVGSTHVVEVAAAPSTANAEAIGLAAEQMVNNAFGHAVQHGLLEDVDTDVTNWTVGTKLYLAPNQQTPSGTTKNWLTSTYPTKGTNTQHIGTVTRKNANNGSILVHASGQENFANNMKLGDLTNVQESLTSPQTVTLLLARPPSSLVWGELSSETFANKVHGHELDDIVPVVAQQAAFDGKAPVWDNTNEEWVATAIPAVLNDLTNVNATPSNGDFLKYDSGTSQWIAGAASTGTFPDAPNFTNGQIPVSNGTTWSGDKAPLLSAANSAVGTYARPIVKNNVWSYEHPYLGSYRCRTQNDFILNVGEYTAFTSGTGAATSTTAITNIEGHPGICQIQTGTTTTGYAGLGYQSVTANCIFGVHKYTYEAIVQIPTLSNATDPFYVQFGFANSRTTAAPSNGIFFYYTHSANSGNWTCSAYGNSTTVTTYDTGTAVVANTWYNLRIVVYYLGTSTLQQVDWYINGALVNSTISASLPFGSSQAAAPTATIRKNSSGTNSRTINLDYLGVIIDFASER